MVWTSPARHRAQGRAVPRWLSLEQPFEGALSMGKSITDLSSVTTVGLDLAKHVFQVHGIDASGRVIVAKALRRKDVRFRANMAREPDQSVLLYRRGPESGCLGEN